MNQAEMGWLAGMIEGEGHIGKDGPTGVRIIVHMVDEDLIRRMQVLTGCGRITGPHQYTENKPTWKWWVQSKRDVVRILLMIAPLLGSRRKDAIMELEDFRFRYLNHKSGKKDDK